MEFTLQFTYFDIICMLTSRNLVEIKCKMYVAVKWYKNRGRDL